MPYYKTQRPNAGGFKKRSFGGSGGRSSYGGGRSNASRGPKKAYIHPSKFVQAAKAVTEEVFMPNHKFTDFGLHQIIERNLAEKGIDVPTPIQDQAILVSMSGKDVVGIANTGTGKTIAFALPVLHRLITDKNAHAIVMAPTRELAQQIEDEVRLFSRGSNVNTAVLIGGTSMGPQLNQLRRRPQLVIGTPGRIKDHMERRSLDVRNFNIVVLDEVDRMLDMGFVNDMKQILGKVALVRQSFFFSATMSPTVEALIKTFTREAVTISVKTGQTSDNVEQAVVRYDGVSDKMKKLQTLLKTDGMTKALVFGETKRGVERLHKQLEDSGFAADSIHGGRSQGQRQRALDKFKRSDVKILVATDVAARGIDVKDISHVVNYTTPQTYDDYSHRVGRAGRAGRKGYAFTFIESQ